MDNLTHSLVGLAVARAGLGRGVPYAGLTLVLASNAPDIDIVAAFTGGSLAYLAVHRGPTHGPLGFLGLAILTAMVVHVFAKWRHRRGNASGPDVPRLLPLVGLALVGTVLHGLMDLPTSYGTRLLSPFSPTWFAFDWMPIVDVYLWAVLLAGLVIGRVKPEWRRRVAATVLVIASANYAARALLHREAIAWGATATAAGTESRCAAAPILVRHPTLIEARAAGPGSCVQAAALPTFLSPFTWRIVRQYPHGYELSQRDLLRRDAAHEAVWIPSDGGPEVARARASGTGRVFLDFSRFPAARIVEHRPDAVTVRIVDVRFVGSPLRLEPHPQARAPFVVTIEVDHAGRILREALGN